MNHHTVTLSNGLRVVHLPSHSSVVYCGIALAVGSRHEAAGEEGLAHFCEHTTFKGTRRRTALQILNSLESVGGDLNAFTNKEDTVYYAAIQREHFMRAVDVLTDMVFNSRYPQHEIEHEVDVVCDEIESYNDSPAELIYDEFENMLFQGHPLGHNILGTPERVRSFTSADALRFTSRHYRPERAVFFVHGDIDFNRLVASPKLRDISSGQGLPTDDTTLHSPLATPAVADERHHQAHVMLGCRTFSRNDERRTALYLLNNILGGPAMNARLNLALRERRGLVYTIESTMATYSDTGCWSVYFGCDHSDVKRCLRLVRRELDRLTQAPLSDRQLTAAKRQLRGQLAIACDNHEQYALDVAKNFLHHGSPMGVEELLERVSAVSSSEMQDVAQQLFAPERLQLLTL